MIIEIFLLAPIIFSDSLRCPIGRPPRKRMRKPSSMKIYQFLQGLEKDAEVTQNSLASVPPAGKQSFLLVLLMDDIK